MPGNAQSDPDCFTHCEKPEDSIDCRRSIMNAAISYSIITRLPNYQIHFVGGASILHGDGFHFEPSFSSLKFVLVMNGSSRYLGSSTTVRTSRMTSPLGSGPTLSKYSVIVAFALYGTPFLRK